MKDKLRSLFLIQEIRKKRDNKQVIKDIIGIILGLVAFIGIVIALKVSL